MSRDPSIPPLRDLPAGRLETHHALLLAEIARQSRHRPTLTWTSLRVAAVAAASATVAAAIAVAVTLSWNGGAPSHGVTAPPRLVYSFHVSPVRSITYDGLDLLPVADSADSLTAAYSFDRRSRVPIAVYALARYQAAANGDQHPTSVEWFRTTRQLAVSSQSRDRVDSPSRPVYFVVLHGHFVDKNAYYIGGAAKAPRGTVLSFTIDRKTGQVLDFALARRSPDYAKLGRPHRFSFGAGGGTK
jgi:hypothetical protein